MAKTARVRQRQEFRLGAGEYYDPTRPSYPCRAFLGAVQRLVPEVFDALEKVLDADDAPGVEAGVDPARNPWLDNEKLRKLAEHWGLADPHVYGVLANSMRRWGSGDCFKGRRHSVEDGRRSSREKRRGFYRREWYFPLDDDVAPQPRRFECPAWEPRYETEAEYREALKGCIEDFVDAHIADTKCACLRRGLVPVPTKRCDSGDSPERHFEWLARYQVKGDSYVKIAKDLPKAFRATPQTTVRNAVTATAQLVSLTLRPPRRTGRPRKVGT